MSKPSTRERILAKARGLFNERGERAVTTNHIAQELAISPGNLYYHFRNKSDIITALYQGHQQQVLQLLSPPADRPITMADKALLLEHLAEALWDCRFFYRDTEHILAGSDTLAQLHRDTFNAVFEKSLQLQRALSLAGLIEASEQDQRNLCYNAWIVLINWIGFLRTTLQLDLSDSHCKPLIQRGVYQVLALEKAYMTPQALAQLGDFERRYYVDLAPLHQGSAGPDNRADHAH